MKTQLICVLLFLIVACSRPSKTDETTLDPPKSAETNAANLAKTEQMTQCNAAKVAAVAARYAYDRDYLARSGGSSASGPSLTVEELDACRLVDGGAFVGKWKGMRWRYLPKEGQDYTRNPRKVWVSDTDESEAQRTWFSEWRGDFAPKAKSQELTKLLAKSVEVES